MSRRKRSCSKCKRPQLIENDDSRLLSMGLFFAAMSLLSLIGAFVAMFCDGCDTAFVMAAVVFALLAAQQGFRFPHNLVEKIRSLM